MSSARPARPAFAVVAATALFTAAGFAHAASNLHDIALADCNVSPSWAIDSPVLGRVVLHLDMEVEELPGRQADTTWAEQTAQFRLAFEDGHEIDLGRGGKYYDDIDWTDPPSCGDLVELASGLTRATLAGRNAADIAVHPGLALHSWTVRELAPFDDEDCDPLHDGRCGLADSLEGFSRLLTVDAPTLFIRRSTYYGSVVAIDPTRRSAHNLYDSGC